jgi:hypothetical protein
VAQQYQLSFTPLELKGLWVLATGGSTAGDDCLEQAAQNAIDKLYRAEKGMPRRAPHDQGGGRYTDGINLTRKPA